MIKQKEEYQNMTRQELYSEINKRMSTALLFHSRMSDYFNFIGLHGFKRIHEYQYYCEVIGKRKLHKKVLDLHNELIVETGHDKPDIIPVEWYKHTRMDIDDNVVAKYARMAIKTYREWEHETKEMYECIACIFMERGELCDYELINCYVKDVQHELKKIYRLCEELNDVGYDTVYIMEIQKRIHNEYKNKMRKLRVQK